MVRRPDKPHVQRPRPALHSLSHKYLRAADRPKFTDRARAFLSPPTLPTPLPPLPGPASTPPVPPARQPALAKTAPNHTKAARVSRQRAQVPNAYLPPASLGQHQRYLEPIAAPLHCSTSAAPQHRAPQVAFALPPLLVRVAINHPIAPARIAAQSLSTVLQLLRKRQLLWADLSVVAARAPRTTNARDARAPLELHHSPARAHARELHCASTCRCLGRYSKRPAQARNVADSCTPARPLISAAARSPVTPRPRHEHSPPAATASHPRCISASLHLPATAHPAPRHWRLHRHLHPHVRKRPAAASCRRVAPPPT